MLLTLNIAPGVLFSATAASIGLAEERAQAMRTTLLVDDSSDFVWQQVRAASDRLYFSKPAGNC